MCANLMCNLFKFKNEDTRRCHWRPSDICIVNSEQISHIPLVHSLFIWTSNSQPGQELLQFWPKFESQIQATWLLVKKCVTSCGWVFLNLFSTCFICMPCLDMLSVTSENGSNYFTSSKFKQFLHGEHNVLLTSWCLISKDSGQWY